MTALKIAFMPAFFLFLNYTATAQSTNLHYNKALADSLGADDYGMKKYVFVILKTGKVAAADKTQRDSLFRGHMQNIVRLADKGLLVVSGPMPEKKNNCEGIFILNVKTVTEAEELLNTDPAIKAGLLETDLYQWYGSAALPLYLPNHVKVQRMEF